MAKTPHNLAKSDVIDQMPLACADERAAIEFFESQRWGGCPACVHCRSINVYTIKDRDTGERRADGRWRCRGCGKQFTVRVGNIMEDSPIPLYKWAYVFWCAATAKNGVSALEMSRKIQVTYKSALFMMNRIRWAMRETNPPKLNGTIEADETYIGGSPRYPQRLNGRVKKGPNPNKRKTPVFAVVERGGEVRACVMANVTSENIREVLGTTTEPETSNLMTDDHNLYKSTNTIFANHATVNHTAREYVNRDNPSIHTNTIEGFFSRIERGLDGVYHAVSSAHLFRYVDQYSYLYNGRLMNDGERISDLVRSADGKRLTFKEYKRQAS